NAMHARNRAVQMARGVRHAMALAAGENASLFMQAIAVTVAGGTNKGRLADPWQRRVPDDRDALLLLAIVQQKSGPLCRELAEATSCYIDQQFVSVAEMSVGRRRTHSRPAGSLREGKAGRSLLRDQFQRRADQGLFQIAMVIAART